MDRRQQIREDVWSKLAAVAWPDSRYHLDFSEFIPGYDGCEDVPETLSGLPFYHGTGPVFVTPDGSTEPLRAFLLRKGRPLLTATHGGRRGFRFFRPGSVPLRSAEFAATLDGAERFGEQLATADGLRALGPLDFLVTGASAVSENGIRFGKGHGYFDIEWAIFTTLGLACEQTPVVACVHDVQVTEGDLPAGPNDTSVDWIITPARVFQTIRRDLRPSGIDWNRLGPEAMEANSVLRDLRGASPARGRSMRLGDVTYSETSPFPPQSGFPQALPVIRLAALSRQCAFVAPVRATKRCGASPHGEPWCTCGHRIPMQAGSCLILSLGQWSSERRSAGSSFGFPPLWDIGSAHSLSGYIYDS